MMVIIRKCPKTGEVKSLFLPITEAQMSDWVRGIPVNRAFPSLSAKEKTFIKIGLYE
jgi:hypothetical protein